jgi:hypothetical protein
LSLNFSIRPKSQIFNLVHDYALLIESLLVMMEKSENPDFDFVLDWTDNLNGSVDSIVDLKPKGSGFESRISQGFFLI